MGKERKWGRGQVGKMFFSAATILTEWKYSSERFLSTELDNGVPS
jgi:hypothetical protein